MNDLWTNWPDTLETPCKPFDVRPWFLAVGVGVLVGLALGYLFWGLK